MTNSTPPWRTPTEDHDQLRRTGEAGPYAEDCEDVRDAPGRSHAEGDRGDGADRGVRQQQLPSRSLLAPRVDQRGDQVDHRVEDKQNADTDRQGVRRHREHDGPGDRDDAAGQEELQGPCIVG